MNIIIYIYTDINIVSLSGGGLMALFGKLKGVLNTKGRMSDTDISLEYEKNNRMELTQSVHEIPKDDAEKEKQRLVNILTPRELDLYYLLLEGYTLKESAKELSVKYSTVNTHMTAIYKKLKVNSRAELIIKYIGTKGC